MYLSNILIFMINGDSLLVELLSEKAANPLKKRARLIIKELYVLVTLFINKQ